MSISGLPPPGGDGSQRPTSNSSQGPSKEPQNRRNPSEPVSLRCWNKQCGKQLEILIGIRGLEDARFAVQVGVSTRSSRNWRTGRKALSARRVMARLRALAEK